MTEDELVRGIRRCMQDPRHTQESAAHELGIGRDRLRHICRRHGITFDTRYRKGHRYSRRTLFRGQQRSLAEIARMTGLRPELVYHRYWRGWRGDDLGRTSAKKGVPRQKRLNRGE